MKIAVAQTQPIRGNVPANIEAHKKPLLLAASSVVDAVFFPELSVTSYEPALAHQLIFDTSIEEILEKRV